MHFFFDAQISYRLCKMLDAVEEGGPHHLVHITQHHAFKHNNNEYGNSTPDTQWLQQLGTEGLGWIVISGDNAILETPHERAALRSSRLTFFALDARFQNVSMHEQAWKLLRIWPEIKIRAAGRAPVLYKVAMGRRLSVTRV